MKLLIWKRHEPKPERAWLRYSLKGDLVLVINEPIMKKGVHPDKPIVIDIEDKVTSLAEEDTMENRLALVKRTMNSLIGETSNCATGYLNKIPKSDEQRKKYEGYVDLLSVINRKMH